MRRKISGRENRRTVGKEITGRRHKGPKQARSRNCRESGKPNPEVRGVRRGDALLNQFGRIGGKCLRSPHIASGASHRPIPSRLGFHCKKERQQAEA